MKTYLQSTIADKVTNKAILDVLDVFGKTIVGR